MSTASVPTGQVAAEAPNPLGRVALIIAVSGVVISGAWMIIQLTVFNRLFANADNVEATMATFSMLATVVYGVTLVLALAAFVVAVLAWRRPGLSKVAAALALGASGSTAATFLAAATGNGLLALLQR